MVEAISVRHPHSKVDSRAVATEAMDKAADQGFLACQGISVRYGSTQALRNVSLSFDRGQIHAIVGQNGAGKSTLARVLAGLVKPDTGMATLDGFKLPAGDVQATRRAGVEIVHQSFSLPPSFTIAEALELFSKERRRGVYRRRSLDQRWGEALATLELSSPATSRIRDLPVEILQSIEITRALAGDAEVLILDEPTAVLTPSQSTRLFDRLKHLRDRGVTILIVLHKLREVSEVADTVTALRGGEVVLPRTPLSDTSQRMLSDLIVGPAFHASAPRPVAQLAPVASDVDQACGAAIELREVWTAEGSTGAALRNVSMTVNRGEIVGVAGVEGNGQRALVEAIMGIQSVASGSLLIGGADATSMSTADRRRRGVRAVPFDRNTEGCSTTTTLWENIHIQTTIVQRARGAVGWLLSPHRLRSMARDVVDAWSVRFASVDQLAGELSGGNLQRLIFSREVDSRTRFLVAAQPCRGLDIAASEFVRGTLRRLRENDVSVLLVSSDLDELLDLSDRIVVICGGELVRECSPPYDLSGIGDGMLGVKAGAA